MVPSGERRAVCYESNGVDVWFDGGALSHRRDTPTTTSGGQRRAACWKNTVVAVWFDGAVLQRYSCDKSGGEKGAVRSKSAGTAAWFDGGVLSCCRDTATTNLAERKELCVPRAPVQLRGLTVVCCRVAEIQLRQIWRRERSCALQERRYSCVV